MAGKRQHFIPRFLIEGFASHRRGDEVFTWVYRSDRPPFNTNTRNAAVEGMFYSAGEDGQADDRITNEEGRMAALVGSIRAGEDRVEPRQLAELVAHFEIRTRHIRQNFSGAASELVDKMLSPVMQPLLLEHLVRRLSGEPGLLKDAIARELRKAGLPESATEQVYRAVLPLVPKMVPRISTFMPILFAEIRRRMPEIIPAAVKQGHLRVLRDDIAPEKRVARYSGLPYRVLRVPGRELPLGDSIVLIQMEDTTFKPFLSGEGEPRAVVLPLASDVVVIGGEISGGLLAPSISQAIARCSLEFFVAASKSASLENSAAQIGADSALLSDDEMEGLIERALFEGPHETGAP